MEDDLSFIKALQSGLAGKIALFLDREKERMVTEYSQRARQYLTELASQAALDICNQISFTRAGNTITFEIKLPERK